MVEHNMGRVASSILPMATGCDMSEIPRLDYTNRSALKKYLAAIVVIVVLGVLVTKFQLELGLVEPGKGARAAVAAATEVDQVLEAGADYDEFSDALRVAIVAHFRMPVANTADGRVWHILDPALDCWSAVREAWQVDLEGQWDHESFGDADYWRGAHRSLTLDGLDDVTVDRLIEACRQEGAEYLEQAVGLVEDR